jgi:sortase A
MAAEVVVTLVWQEPFSALSAKRSQNLLSKKLAVEENAALGTAAAKGDANARMAVLAADLERRTHPGDPLGRISIPKLGTKFVFVSGTGTGSLKKGPGHYRDTALPGRPGTVGIAGHRTTYLAPFRNLHRLRRGDALVLKMPYGIFVYLTKRVITVAPSDARPLRQHRTDRLVLTTCTPPFSAAKRLVVIATLASGQPIAGAGGPRRARAATFADLQPNLFNADRQLFAPVRQVR